MRNISAMVVSLVALAFVVMGLSLNPNPAWAKSTPLTGHTAGSTSVDPRPAYNREEILALQGRVDTAEAEIARLERMRASFKVACGDVADSACQADVRRLTAQIKALKAEIVRIDAARATDRLWVQGEIVRIDAARAADRLWVEQQIVLINTALATAKSERQQLSRRLNTLEEAFRPMAWGMGGVGFAARNPMSAYGVSGTAFNPGMDFGLGLENNNLGVVLQGSWKAEIGGDLAGQTFGGNAMVYTRALRRADMGGGLAVSTTRLVDSESILRYTATGPGLTAVALGRPPKRGGQHLHMQWKVQATVIAARTYAYGEGYGVKPQFALSVGLGAAATSRTE